MLCKEIIAAEIAAKLPQVAVEDILSVIEVPKEKAMGDYAFPCFRFAKALQKKPMEIAAELVQTLSESTLFSKVQAVGPYLNMFIDPSWYAGHILQMYKDAAKDGREYGSSDEGNGKTVVMDYSSINVAKPFHIGHLRTTVIGNSISRILKFLGYKTVSINYLGDWGTQFGKMVTAYRKWGSEEDEQKGVRGLLALYVRFHEEAEKDPSLNDEARAAFVALEQGDEEALALWRRFVDISLKEVQRVYKMLDVEFDSYLGESYFYSRTDSVVNELKEKGLLRESEGAQIVDLEDAGMPPCLILKSDGSTLYATRDIASAFFRKEKYQFDTALYITGLEQQLHFAQWFKVIDKMGYDWAKNLVHIPYGLVSLESGKLSTRSGNVIFLEDILKEAIEKTKAIMQEKNPDLEDMDTVAEEVGVGAVVFHDLFNNRIKDVTFSWDAVLNFDGETGPYVQYTYARACSVLRKGQWNGDLSAANPADLTDEYAQEILHLLEEFPERVREACRKWEPYVITRYAVALATSYNKFYHENMILTAEGSLKESRLALTQLMAETLKKALYLIGVKAPERM